MPELGAFSVSLSVKDLQASKVFYETLGFTVFGGAEEHNYLIMKNGQALVGLFHGMFEGNALTFNPGWDHSARDLDEFVDVRELADRFEKAGLEVTNRNTPEGGGPGSFTLMDPDGNPIFVDQHR
jgi:catechol 2,3-dioxygenase-like lactoylglutathione lyase family enzyme